MDRLAAETDLEKAKMATAAAQAAAEATAAAAARPPQRNGENDAWQWAPNGLEPFRFKQPFSFRKWFKLVRPKINQAKTGPAKN